MSKTLIPFAEWLEDDSSTHGILSDPAVWEAAKTAYQQESDAP